MKSSKTGSLAASITEKPLTVTVVPDSESPEPAPAVEQALRASAAATPAAAALWWSFMVVLFPSVVDAPPESRRIFLDKIT